MDAPLFIVVPTKQPGAIALVNIAHITIVRPTMGLNREVDGSEISVTNGDTIRTVVPAAEIGERINKVIRGT